MRLKKLELQGYKTFATRTGFEFDAGITAVVGPNGSGKSNIADALRWVLGEQSYSTLRGKRTEDMIFSGSALRARLGMASASLVLDNEDGWLPIDFTEVTVARRAYRSGENEYLLNGKRVRLRDVTELLSKSGLAKRSYTVIGQGLVDAVLSLRPDDRRVLFEEAAGIALHRSKRTEALSRLDETHNNLLRVSDIVSEIAPRLSRLRREAERAELHALLTQQLDGQLRTWYGYRWRQMQLGLRRAQDALARRERRLARRREALEAHDAHISAIRSRQAQVREQLSAWHRESGDLHRQMEQVQRDLAVWQERARLLARRSEELEVEAMQLGIQEQATVDRLETAEAEVAAVLVELRNREAEVAGAQAELDDLEAKRGALSEQLAEAQAQILELSTEQSDLRNRVARIEERKTALETEKAEHEAAIGDHEARATQLWDQAQTVAAEQVRLETEEKGLGADAARLEAELSELDSRREALRVHLHSDERQVERLESRHELLERMRDEGEGLRAGVRAVLRASRVEPPALTGVLGTVAQLMHVPAEHETAIELALGNRLQDIIVETWEDAESAVAFLDEADGGRATFLPLDSLRPPSRVVPTADLGVLGVGSELVEASEALSPAIEILLGRTILVTDLNAARRLFVKSRGDFQIVTQQGEILRSTGSVAGGRGGEQKRAGVLAREREWRDLPLQLRQAQDRVNATQAELANLVESAEQARERLTILEDRLQGCAAATVRARAERADLERQSEQVAQQVTWFEGLVAKLDAEAVELVAHESKLRTELKRLVGELGPAEEQLGTLRTGLDELQGESLYNRLSEARTAAAVARGSWQHRQSAMEALVEQRADLEAQSAAKQERIAALGTERKALAEQIAGQVSQEAVIQGWLTSLANKNRAS